MNNLFFMEVKYYYDNKKIVTEKSIPFLWTFLDDVVTSDSLTSGEERKTASVNEENSKGAIEFD